MYGAVKPFTPLHQLVAPKVTRSLSVSSSLSSSSGSSTSSTYSRTADDMLDRLAAQDAQSTFHLWSAGNIRLNGRDLTMHSRDTAELVEAIRMDGRFEITSVLHLDNDGEDWKITFRRTDSPPSPPLSDTE